MPQQTQTYLVFLLRLRASGEKLLCLIPLWKLPPSYLPPTPPPQKKQKTPLSTQVVSPLKHYSKKSPLCLIWLCCHFDTPPKKCHFDWFGRFAKLTGQKFARLTHSRPFFLFALSPCRHYTTFLLEKENITLTMGKHSGRLGWPFSSLRMDGQTHCLMRYLKRPSLLQYRQRRLLCPGQTRVCVFVCFCVCESIHEQGTLDVWGGHPVF